jgi:hypothetical protein
VIGVNEAGLEDGAYDKTLQPSCSAKMRRTIAVFI